MPRAPFFDVSRPAAWKRPVVAFVLVAGLCLTANAVPYPMGRYSGGGRIRLRGWPDWYWLQNETGYTRYRAEEAAWNIAVSALMAVCAFAAVRWVTILRQGAANEADSG
ncbi:hypothetical protein [Alienimonas sp. DA493]|uniref:hypothetical protein n=1 Tax=Alienimonas sp. DA493 TaxID=3373605 RepID=UPI003755068B